MFYTYFVKADVAYHIEENKDTMGIIKITNIVTMMMLSDFFNHILPTTDAEKMIVKNHIH